MQVGYEWYNRLQDIKISSTHIHNAAHGWPGGSYIFLYNGEMSPTILINTFCFCETAAAAAPWPTHGSGVSQLNHPRVNVMQQKNAFNRFKVFQLSHITLLLILTKKSHLFNFPP